MHAHNPSIESLLDELKRYLDDSDMTHIEHVAAEIQERIRRFDEQS